MTGFGRAEETQNETTFTVEIRSVNHRYCDVVARLPRQFSPLEDAIKKWVKQRVERGHLDVVVHCNMPLERSHTLDLSSAKAHYKMLGDLKAELGLSGEITLEHLLHNKDFILPIEPVSPGTIPSLLLKALGNAMDGLDQTRLREGRALSKEILTRIRGLSKVVLQIEIDQKRGLKERYQRLLKRVEELTAHSAAMDPQRLTQELALLTDRNDMSEEVTRLKAHFLEFQRLLRHDGPVGRALDFLTQEISREINTLGSKANDEKISLQVVTMKCEMEKVREQIQNIE